MHLYKPVIGITAGNTVRADVIANSSTFSDLRIQWCCGISECFQLLFKDRVLCLFFFQSSVYSISCLESLIMSHCSKVCFSGAGNYEHAIRIQLPRLSLWWAVQCTICITCSAAVGGASIMEINKRTNVYMIKKSEKQDNQKVTSMTNMISTI